VKNEVLPRVQDERTILRAVKQRKAKWICDICRNSLTNTCYGRKGRRDGKMRKKTSAATGDLRKREGTGTWKKKHYIAFLGEFTLEEGLLQDRLHNEWCVRVRACT
jgi:hypothetical protein